MDDDFNTPQAMAALFDLARDINRASDEDYSVAAAQQALKELSGVLGLTLKEMEKPPLDAEPFIELQKSTIAKIRKAKLDKVIEEVEKLLYEQGEDVEDAAPYINLLRGVRDALREGGQFQLADDIRAKLSELGIALEDTVKGTVWRRKR